MKHDPDCACIVCFPVNFPEAYQRLQKSSSGQIDEARQLREQGSLYHKNLLTNKTLADAEPEL